MADHDDRNTTGAQWYLRDYLQPIISSLRGKGLSKPGRTQINYTLGLIVWGVGMIFILLLISNFLAAHSVHASSLLNVSNKRAFPNVYACSVYDFPGLCYYFLSIPTGNLAVKRN